MSDEPDRVYSHIWAARAALKEAGERLHKAEAAALDLEGSEFEGPVVVVHPGRAYGMPTINATRMTTENIAHYTYSEGIDATCSDYDLTRHAVLVACWFDWQYEDRRSVKAKWAKSVSRSLAGWDDAPAVADLPDPPRRP